MIMKTKNIFLMASMMLVALLLVSCGGDDPKEDPTPEEPDPVVANFTATVDGFTVAFENKSVNGVTYSWDFGDTNTSTEESPTHTYEAAGEYTVELTATNEDLENSTTQKVIIADKTPLELLTGDGTKTWVLAPEGYAVSFGNPGGVWYDGLPATETKVQVWWGNSIDQVDSRGCLFDNEYTFSDNGDYDRDINGFLWKEWKVFDAVSGEGCAAETDDLVTQLGTSVNEWKDGSFNFEINTFNADTIFDYTLTTSGKGGYIGHYVSGTNATDYAAHDTHEYGILSITEDRMELISWGWGGDSNENGADPASGDRWYKVVLVPKQ